MTHILYLHGFASGPSSTKARYFQRCFEQAGASVIAPNLAEGDFEHLTITRQLAVVERAAANRPVALIGSSMGGYLAGLYAARHGRYEDYPEFRQPVLLFHVHGRHDEVVPAADSEQFAATHANARLEILDSGHELLNVLDYMAPKVVRFLLDEQHTENTDG